ncbi:hypothetical protein FPV67DRAFT_421627 [Lyophyllum atratum]|nr:hypothetical protein FPV67DRAFT_421627 [Lyophyllum atratum]
MSGTESAPLVLKSPLRGRRIQVVGHAGAGKSTFAVKVAKILQVPVVHLDPIFWSKDWVATPPEQARKIVREYADKDAWVIDGNQWVPLKDITYPRATDIIWIDPPFHIWLYRLLSRALYKAFTVSGSFYKDFLDPKKSIVVQGFRLRKKKAGNWTKLMKKDDRWQRVSSAENFLNAIQKFQDRE